MFIESSRFIYGVESFVFYVWLWSYSPTQKTNIHALSGVRTSDPNSQAAADPRLIPHGHRDRKASFIACN